MPMMHTMQAGYQPLRTSVVTTDDDSLDGTTSGKSYRFLDMPSEAVQFGPEVNACEIVFVGTDTANDTFTWKLWAWRPNGVAKYIGTGTGQLGTAVEGTASTFYANYLTISDQNWLQPVGLIDNADANNRVASLAFDLCGFQYLYIEFTDVGGGGAEANSVNAQVAYF